ncbi:PstS family phosphate ABC transporter substrate-binding protein [Ornithinibacillus scapharcae]|uniref:PstS family phosphate ABC transporter substrate-binding protein n=1 Tax=Ornithinibacillus scapharcae TaxID=1147159 RepID=UPI000225B554|nr:substrate-binding domain-containing protein [Ornithinibacillus scapharcae]
MGFRLFLFLLTSIAICFAAFVVSMVTLFLGIYKFYIPFIIIVTIGILFFVFNHYFNIVKGKALRRSAITFISAAILTIMVYESIHLYDKAIPTLANDSVDLYEYQPFGEPTKAVSLDDPATFKIDGELPKIDGATALYPIYAAFVQATYPEKQYDVYESEVISTRTPYAYENLINGKVDMIFALGPSEAQLKKAENRGVELKLTPIGKEAFVFFVNAKNEVSGLTLDEIKKIYSGEITNWGDVGGANDSIRAFQRPADSGSQTTLEQLMADTPIMTPPTEDIISLMGGIIEETANYKNYKNAIGYTFRFYSNEMAKNDSIRHLAIDGIAPTLETIRNGEYPITETFYVVTAGSENPNIEPFIEWILSSQGQSIIEKTGYVPIGSDL